jgi:hypothetical protein
MVDLPGGHLGLVDAVAVRLPPVVQGAARPAK